MNTTMNHLDQKSSNPSFRLLYRWVWGVLKNGDMLPVWGSVFTSELTKKMRLDFDAFPAFANQEDFKRLYASRKDVFEVWFKKLPENLRQNVSTRIYFALMTLQNGMEQRFNISSEESQDTKFLRNLKYEKATPNLSDFRDGTAHCAERAALGQWMLTALGIPSVYMSGVTFQKDIDDGFDHSWIVLYPDTDKSMIFDIARPGKNQLPNLYKSENPISEDIFIGQDNAFIETQELLSSSTRYFGISHHPSMVTEVGYVVKSYVSTNIMPL